MEQIHHDQASADFYYLSELIRDYIGLVGAVKEAFQVSKTREIAYQGEGALGLVQSSISFVVSCLKKHDLISFISFFPTAELKVD